MKLTYLFKKRVFQYIESDDEYNKLNNFFINYKSNYYFLDNNNINLLKKNKYLVSINTSGHKYILYITDDNKHIFYNKKTHQIYLIKLGFNLTKSVIFDTDLVKTKSGCKLIIHDIIDDTLNLYDRITKMKEIYNLYTYNSSKDFCKVELLQYFEYKHIKYLSTDYYNMVDYMYSGICFKPINGKNKIIHIFDSHKKNKNITKTKIINNKSPVKTVIMGVTIGEMPDTYNLYYNNDDYLEYYGLANIKNIEHANNISKSFKNEEDEYKVFKCNYISKFNKFEPINEVDEEIYTIDKINSIIKT